MHITNAAEYHQVPHLSFIISDEAMHSRLEYSYSILYIDYRFPISILSIPCDVLIVLSRCESVRRRPPHTYWNANQISVEGEAKAVRAGRARYKGAVHLIIQI